jgi:phospholipid/cholesterol/gamma-HCH transport system substrate-binding protein/paraquat-inducible protein B
MSTKANHFKIGVFIITTIVLVVVCIIVLSAGALTRDVVAMETYIDESVQGLSVGSPVKRRGVQIGTVSAISFVSQEYTRSLSSTDLDKFSKYVMVTMAIDRATFPDIVGKYDTLARKRIDQWVKGNGLRLKLSYEGITGIAYLEVDYVDPKRFPPMELAWEPKTFYIPSAPSLLANFTQSVDTIFQMLNDIDFAGVAESMNNALITFDQAVKDAQVDKLRKEMLGLLAEFRETNQAVLAMVKQPEDIKKPIRIPETIARLDKTLDRMDKFIMAIDQDLDLNEMVTNLTAASENLRDLTESAKQYPSQFIFGAPPTPSEVVK